VDSITIDDAAKALPGDNKHDARALSSNESYHLYRSAKRVE
jgi:hypothetical protein